MSDIKIKILELSIKKSTFRLGIRVTGDYDARVRKPRVAILFDNGFENRRLPLPVQTYYPSEDLQKYDFFAAYSYFIKHIFYKYEEHKEENIRVRLEISYGEEVYTAPLMEKSNDLIIYVSNSFEVDLDETNRGLVIQPVPVLETKKGLPIVRYLIKKPLNLIWKTILHLLAFCLLPFFFVEAILSYFKVVKAAPKNKKKRIMRILFHVKWRVSQVIRKKITIAKFRLSLGKLGFALFKRFPVKNNRIVFISNRRESISGNYEYIYDKLIGNKDLDIRTVLDPKEGYKTCFKYGYYLATAKVLLVDDYIQLLYSLPRREENSLIQVWHACGAFKTFGFSRLGRPGGQKQKSKAHRNYDYCTVSSSEICKYYAEGFGLSVEKVIPTGVPRTDMFFSEEYKLKSRTAFYEKYPYLKDKKIILFAPTFRGKGKKTGHYPLARFDAVKIYEHFDGEYVIIVKHHPFVKTRAEIPEEYEGKIIDMSEEEELNELLFVTDLLITDYSSVVFEAGLLNIPMLFYAYDLQNYIASRGFYYEYASFVPGKIVYNMPALIKAIEKKDFEMEKIEPFKHRFFDELDGKAGQRVADLILRLLEK